MLPQNCGRGILSVMEERLTFPTLKDGDVFKVPLGDDLRAGDIVTSADLFGD